MPVASSRSWWQVDSFDSFITICYRTRVTFDAYLLNSFLIETVLGWAVQMSVNRGDENVEVEEQNSFF